MPLLGMGRDASDGRMALRHGLLEIGRQGRDAKEGVVDAWGRVFGYPGLYIADGSVMPGAIGANPSLTIAAFAHRVADGIMNEAGRE